MHKFGGLRHGICILLHLCLQLPNVLTLLDVAAWECFVCQAHRSPGRLRLQTSVAECERVCRVSGRARLNATILLCLNQSACMEAAAWPPSVSQHLDVLFSTK